MESQRPGKRIGRTPFDFDGGNLGNLVHQGGHSQTFETDFCNPFPFEIIVNGNRREVELFLILNEPTRGLGGILYPSVILIPVNPVSQIVWRAAFVTFEESLVPDVVPPFRQHPAVEILRNVCIFHHADQRIVIHLATA